MFISMVFEKPISFLTLSYIFAFVLLSSTAAISSNTDDKSSTRVSRQRSRFQEKKDSRLDNSISARETHSPTPTTSFAKRVKRQAKNPPSTAEIIKSSRQMEFTPELGFYYGFQPSMDSYLVTSSPLNAAQLQSDAPDTFASGALSFASAYSPFQQQQQQSATQSAPVNFNGSPTRIMYFPYRESLAMQQQSIRATAPICCACIPVPVTCQFPVVSGMPDYVNGATLEAARQSQDGAVLTQQYNTHPYKQPFKEYVVQCPDGLRRCGDNSRCVPELLWCDGSVDCPDASDETSCSCRQRIGVRRVCDGYPDCPRGEDELGCYGCPDNTFSCSSSSHHDVVAPSADESALGGGNGCVSTYERCDGSRQCANGRDEEGCSVLMESYKNRSEEMFPVGYTYGFLYKNLRGRWYPVCGHAFRWAKEACDAEIGNISDVPQLEMAILPRHREIGPYLTKQQDGSTMQLQADCPAEFAYVRCPRPRAGMRLAQRQRDEDDVVVGASRGNESSSIDGGGGPIVSIVGGRASSPGAWPFVVAINKNGRFHCGGAILNENWILSAAHCFANPNRHYYEIEAGALRRLSYSPVQQTRRLAGAVVHPSFDRLVLRNDIALCLLDEPLVFNRWIRPVRLPAYDHESVDFLDWRRMPGPGAVCTVAGWGSTVEGENRDPDHLREVDVPIVDCKHIEDRNSAEICAGLIQGGRDACQGDSGGPLMCRVPNTKDQWYLGGIVSHGVGCGRRNEPGAYTKISYFTDWIQSIIYSRTAPATMARPLAKCPGFSCDPPHRHCLPASKRCDRRSDCLGAEDEVNCPSRGFLGFLEHLFG